MGFGIITNKRVLRFNYDLERQLPIEDIADVDFKVYDEYYPSIRIISKSALPYINAIGEYNGDSFKYYENSFRLTMPRNEICQEFMASIGSLKSKRSKKLPAEKDQNDPLLVPIKQKMDSLLYASLPRIISPEKLPADQRLTSEKYAELAQATGTALCAGAKETLAKARIYYKERLIELGFPKHRQQSLGECIEFTLAPWKDIYNKEKEKTLVDWWI
jgi:hypothetical protein